jgi:RND family efflux transporter MFP subunit
MISNDLTMTYFQLKHTRPHLHNTIIFIAACACLTGVLAIISSKTQAADAPKAVAPKAALTVTTTQAVPSQLPIKLSANGNIAAWQEASIGSEANGLRLLEVRVAVGDSVRQGQVLARFNSETLQAEITQGRAALAEAQATALDAQGNAERARSLKSTGAMSEQQINQFLTGELTANARVESAKAMLVVQQQHLKNTQVLAPDSGIISVRNATVGAVVGSGAELFRMIRQGRLEWRAEVTSAELGRINVGTVVNVTSASGAQIKGRVRVVAPTVDPQTRAAMVYVDLTVPPAQANSVKAGMFAKGEFELGSTAALTVPQTAVLIRDGFSYVYIVGADSRVTQTKVQTGRRAGDRVEVAGVPADARLVASGGGFLNTGDLVHLVGISVSTAAKVPVVPATAASK